MNTGDALWIIGKESVEVRRETLQDLSTTEVRIKAMYSSISVGTERLVFTDSVPKKLYSMMRVPYQGGNFPFPVKYGYSLIGKIVESNEKSLIDQTVHLMHPHQNWLNANLADLTILPNSINPSLAVHISNLETAVNAIWDSRIELGDKVLIVGFGTIGSLISMVLRRFGYRDVTVTDVSASKLQIAKNLNISALTKSELVEMEDTFDLSFHCSGSEDGLQTAINAIGLESKCIDVSWYGNKFVNLKLGETFHPMRKQLISSQVSNIPFRKVSRWDTTRRKELVISLLDDGVMSDKFSQIIEFSKIEEEYPKVVGENSQDIQTLIKY